MPYKTLICEKCGKTFKVGVASKKRVCKECQPTKVNFHRKVITCGFCGQLFETIRSNQVYCCKRCKELARERVFPKKDRVEKICKNPFCKKAFLAKRNQNYCSKDCAKVGAKVARYE